MVEGFDAVLMIKGAAVSFITSSLCFGSISALGLRYYRLPTAELLRTALMSGVMFGWKGTMVGTSAVLMYTEYNRVFKKHSPDRASSEVTPPIPCSLEGSVQPCDGSAPAALTPARETPLQSVSALLNLSGNYISNLYGILRSRLG